ncbi:MAG TPA: hypothetical protein GX747_04470, partial [Tenericutes bacterium]|nr:hypothetical protein [Mycoplasmatota bacterium]
MKKIIILMIMIATFYFLISINNKSDEVPVFLEGTDNNYDIYDIDLSNINITTKNILVFKD